MVRRGDDQRQLREGVGAGGGERTGAGHLVALGVADLDHDVEVEDPLGGVEVSGQGGQVRGVDVDLVRVDDVGGAEGDGLDHTALVVEGHGGGAVARDVEALALDHEGLVAENRALVVPVDRVGDRIDLGNQLREGGGAGGGERTGAGHLVALGVADLDHDVEVEDPLGGVEVSGQGGQVRGVDVDLVRVDDVGGAEGDGLDHTALVVEGHGGGAVARDVEALALDHEGLVAENRALVVPVDRVGDRIDLGNQLREGGGAGGGERTGAGHLVALGVADLDHDVEVEDPLGGVEVSGQGGQVRGVDVDLVRVDDVGGAEGDGLDHTALVVEGHGGGAVARDVEALALDHEGLVAENRALVVPVDRVGDRIDLGNQLREGVGSGGGERTGAGHLVALGVADLDHDVEVEDPLGGVEVSGQGGQVRGVDVDLVRVDDVGGAEGDGLDHTALVVEGHGGGAVARDVEALALDHEGLVAENRALVVPVDRVGDRIDLGNQLREGVGSGGGERTGA